MSLPSFPTLAALHSAYAAGLSVEDAVRETYERIRAVADPGIFIALLPEETVLAAARALGRFDASAAAKPLWGVPFAVKDNIDVAQVPTTAACPAFTYTPVTSAFAVQKLLDAGALFIGKTNLDQFATGLVGIRTPYPIPLNPFNPAYIPGGSSSGSAIAVAHGLVCFAIGTDTAGSGRVPAGLNNVVGLKPSLGTVSSRGLVPACRTLDTLSVFAGTVGDAERVYRVMARYDADDPWSRPSAVLAADAVPGQLRIGIPDATSRKFGGDVLAQRAFDASVADLVACMGNSRVSETDLSALFQVGALLYDGPWVAERGVAARALLESSPSELHPTTRQILRMGDSFRALEAFEGFYRLAQLRRLSEATWQNVDLLVIPTYPRPRTLADLAADSIGPNSELGTYTNFVNLLDLCALAVPGRFRADGLPSGVTLIAPHGHDRLLAAVGSILHASSGATLGHTGEPVPPMQQEPTRASPASSPSTNEIELAVVGAHLSGMPLNHELVSLGARLLRAVPTATEYRLFALPGPAPQRPGLLRVSAHEGVAIATEVWALPSQGFARFVANIPAPLGIATLRLADGTHPKGFVVESLATQGASDVSRFGGWRAYVGSLASR